MHHPPAACRHAQRAGATVSASNPATPAAAADRCCRPLAARCRGRRLVCDAGGCALAPGGGACLRTLGATPGAAEGTIAPAGGCPGNFFTSRKWTFEHDMLIIRDHKNEALAELSFSAGRFQGQAPGGGSGVLPRP